uniref:Uncharacterized protein n=1 Tax=Oryza punctata TaxID=4537 RepID=A0A0E0K0K7_ORYPU
MVRIARGSSVSANVNHLGTWPLEAVATTKPLRCVCPEAKGAAGSNFPRLDPVEEVGSSNVDHLYGVRCGSDGDKGGIGGVDTREPRRLHEEVAWRDKGGAWRGRRRGVTRPHTIAVHEASMAHPCVAVLEWSQGYLARFDKLDNEVAVQVASVVVVYWHVRVESELLVEDGNDQ